MKFTSNTIDQAKDISIGEYSCWIVTVWTLYRDYYVSRIHGKKRTTFKYYARVVFNKPLWADFHKMKSTPGAIIQNIYWRI